MATAEILTKDGGKKIEPDMPFGIEDHCMVLINSTTAMIIGGRALTVQSSNHTYFYHFDTNIWRRGPDLMFPRNKLFCGMVKKSKESDEVVINYIVYVKASWEASSWAHNTFHLLKG